MADEEEKLVIEHLSTFEYYFFLTNGWVGTVLNLIVLFIAIRHADTHDKPRQIIVMNMTFADLLTCTVYMLTRSRLNQFPEFICYPYYICIFTSQICSCVNLLWLNVDKLIYIKFPLHYYQLVRRRRVLILTIFTWFFFILFALIAYARMVVRNACDRVEINQLIYLAIIIMYVIVIVLSFVISAIIYCIAHNFRRTEPQAQNRIFQRLFFLFSSTLWTFVTCLPYRVLYLVSLLLPSCYTFDENDMPLNCELTNSFYRILVVGIVINPLITVVTQRMYRQHLMKYLQEFCGFSKRLLPSYHIYCCGGGSDGRSVGDKNGGTLTTTTPTAENANSSPKILKNNRLLTARHSSVNSNKFGAEEARLTTISEC